MLPHYSMPVWEEPVFYFPQPQPIPAPRGRVVHPEHARKPAQYYPPIQQYNSHHTLPSSSNFQVPLPHVHRLPHMETWAKHAPPMMKPCWQPQPSVPIPRRQIAFRGKPPTPTERATCLSILKERTPEEMKTDIQLQKSIHKVRKSFKTYEVDRPRRKTIQQTPPRRYVGTQV